MVKVVGPILKFFFTALFMPLLVHSSSTIEEETERERPAGFKSSTTQNRSGPFFRRGQVNMFDNALTQGPESTSKGLGRAQGLYGFASQEEFSLLMAVTFVFTSGNHNGSSTCHSLAGGNTVIQSPREFPIVGGTGNFRLARGFAWASNYFANTSLAVVEYNVAIIHY